MRLGAYDCSLTEGTLAQQLYNTNTVSERHRHRWEFNNAYLQNFSDAGLVMSGLNVQKGLVEIIELPNHPFFIGVQYHPELKSTVENPHPLFVGLVRAAIAYANWREQQTVEKLAKESL